MKRQYLVTGHVEYSSQKLGTIWEGNYIIINV